MNKKTYIKKKSIVQFINEYYGKSGCIPTARDIVAGTGIPLAKAQLFLAQMKENGNFAYDGHRSTETSRMDKECFLISIPVLEEVHRNLRNYDEKDILEYIRLPESLIGVGNFFALIAQDESLTGVGIYSGDHVIVRKQNTANAGDIVVALYDDNDAGELQELSYDHKGNPIFRSHNSNYQDIYPENLLIQGVAMYVIHRLKNEIRE